MAQAREDLAIDQREVGRLIVQYHPNPQHAPLQGIMPVDIVKKQADIEKKRRKSQTFSRNCMTWKISSAEPVAIPAAPASS
jgi:hypothetical protein